MRYHSTRAKEDFYSPKEAVLKGLCDDGGLFVTDELPEDGIDLGELFKTDYKSLALDIMGRFFDDIPREELKKAISEAYDGKFMSSLVTPLTEIGDDWLLELYHGPTQAFKDVALCMLPKLMSLALKDRDERIMIVTATSGDTGKAALSGFQDAEHIAITVFYPHQGVSDIQYLQMATQEGSNVFVGAVKGNFDDCQTEVKEIFSSKEAEKLLSEGVHLSSANSINIGRLVPQIVYYADAYRQLLMRGEIELHDKVDFCVPTGNFGDVLAGYLAKRMGLPIGKLIVASNDNKILTDFLSTGVYDKRREFKKTISPSMDILVSSNLERLLYYESGGDAELVAGLMSDLKEKGVFEIDKELLARIRETFDCGYADEAEARRTIREAYSSYDRVIDPHTAVALCVAEKYKKERDKEGEARPLIVLSTASPYKFARDVYESIFGASCGEADSPSDEEARKAGAASGEGTLEGRQETKEGGEPDGFYYMEMLYQRTKEPIPKPLSELRKKEIRHKAVLRRDEMAGFVYDNAKVLKPEGRNS